MSEVKEVELSAEMKIQKANMQKEKGNEHFKVPNTHFIIDFV